MLHRPAGMLVALFGTLLWGSVGLSPLDAQVTAPGPGTIQPGGPPISVGGNQFIRGDANVDGMVNIADGIEMLSFLFSGATIDCLAAADMNSDGSVDISDPIGLFGFLFQGQAAPGAPFPNCGNDTVLPILACASFDACGPATDRATAAHILRRIAYGPTPAELEDLETIGADAFIAEQLDPFNIAENPQVDAKINAVPITSNYVNYYRHVLLRGRYSNRQLLEQMTDFWSNHFNTYYWTFRAFVRDLPAGGFNGTTSLVPAMVQEAIEDEVFRQNALGPFETLLLLSATSPTMLVYLDNVSNIVGNPNENYARELLELHTVGVNGGYTQGGIEELARCFTGWTVHKVLPADFGDPFAPSVPDNDPAGIWSFKFEPADHDYGEKNLFASMGIPLTIPARPANTADGVLDGLEVIQHLAGTSLTAEYVSFKMIQKFVTDEPPPALVASCIGTWLSTNGQIGAVLDTILSSPEFRGNTYRFGKIKTPMETLLSTVRMLEGETTDANQMRNYLGTLRHLPLNFNTPDGYPELGDDWMGTSKLVDTIHFNEIIVNGSSQLTYNPRTIQQAAGVDEADASAVVTFWLDLMFAGGYNATDVGLAVAFLESNDFEVVTPLVPAAGDYDNRLRKFLMFLRSWPQAMKQ